MHVIHSHAGKSVDEHVNKPVSFFMSDKKGGYLALGESNFTHLQGLFFFDSAAWSPYRTVESIVVPKKMTEIRHTLASCERHYEGNTKEVFSLMNNSMLYSISDYTGDIKFNLDFRYMFSHPGAGRIYSIFADHELVVIKYEQFSDGSLSKKEHERFMAIAGAKQLKKIDSWEKKVYEYDIKRKSAAEMYVYNGFSVACNGSLDLVMSFGLTQEEACNKARALFHSRESLMHKMQKYMVQSFHSSDLAFNIASKAIDDLFVHVPTEHGVAVPRSSGIFAGLPWFYQFWARDELISVRALIIAGKFRDAKEILMYYLGCVGEDGLLPNRMPHSDLKSVDAIGWLFIRLSDLLHEVSHKKLFERYFSKEELFRVKAVLERSIQGITHHYVKDGFVHGNAKESWMDTAEARRSGCFVECQAFLLFMMKFHTELSRMLGSKELFRHDETDFAEKVKAAYFKNGKILDTLHGELPGEISRPNLFVAYYAYPELLSSDDWKKAFDSALKELWLDWGGVSTIGHSTPHFVGEYAGQTDKSYHSGDSWYYINNIAAIAMQRLDAKYYAKQVARIVHASREELLFSGFIGCSAEVSSAKELRSEGCLNQAWSAATFVELLKEI